MRLKSVKWQSVRMSISHNQKINNWCFPRNEKKSIERRKRPPLSTLCPSPASGLKPHAHMGLTQGRQDRKPLPSGRHALGPCTPARFPATPSQRCPRPPAHVCSEGSGCHPLTMGTRGPTHQVSIPPDTNILQLCGGADLPRLRAWCAWSRQQGQANLSPEATIG